MTHYELNLGYESLGSVKTEMLPLYTKQDEMVATYTVFQSAALASRKRTVLNMYYTSSPNNVITALSGLLSILVLVINKLFPKIDQVERVAPVMVRNSHPMMKKCLYCEWCRIMWGRLNKEDFGEGVSVDNPAVGSDI